MILCRLGIHRWRSKAATFRAGTTINRCTACGLVRVKRVKPGKPI